MIKLSDAELISVLPSIYKNEIDVQAISYAFKMAMEKMIAFARLSSLYSNIDDLPEDILDLMALECRSQYYDESMEIGIKRNIIRNSLAWHAKGGTVSAVQEMISTIFKNGEVVEWFTESGDPGTFDIVTDSEMSPDAIKQFNKIIKYVKNSRSHLRTLKVKRNIEQKIYIAAIGTLNRKIIVKGGE